MDRMTELQMYHRVTIGLFVLAGVAMLVIELLR